MIRFRPEGDIIVVTDYDQGNPWKQTRVAEVTGRFAQDDSLYWNVTYPGGVTATLCVEWDHESRMNNIAALVMVDRSMSTCSYCMANHIFPDSTTVHSKMDTCHDCGLRFVGAVFTYTQPDMSNHLFFAGLPIINDKFWSIA